MKAIFIVYEIKIQFIGEGILSESFEMLSEYDSFGEEIEALQHIDLLIHDPKFKNKKFTYLKIYES